jgi:MazG family protein
MTRQPNQASDPHVGSPRTGDAQTGEPIYRLLAVMAKLRDPAGGCPWDRAQTFLTIAPYTIEEAYEVADAIAKGDMGGLKDELGDLLFQVVFHSRMAEEAKLFDFNLVAQGIVDKMLRRHPHVFGSETVRDAREQTVAWEQHKAAERAARDKNAAAAGVLDDVATALPAATRAVKLQARAAQAGFDWPDVSSVLKKVEEEIIELRQAIDGNSSRDKAFEELGDVWFALTNVARRLSPMWRAGCRLTRKPRCATPTPNSSAAFAASKPCSAKPASRCGNRTWPKWMRCGIRSNARSATQGAFSRRKTRSAPAVNAWREMGPPFGGPMKLTRSRLRRA